MCELFGTWEGDFSFQHPRCAAKPVLDRPEALLRRSCPKGAILLPRQILGVSDRFIRAGAAIDPPSARGPRISDVPSLWRLPAPLLLGGLEHQFFSPAALYFVVSTVHV